MKCILKRAMPSIETIKVLENVYFEIKIFLKNV